MSKKLMGLTNFFFCISSNLTLNRTSPLHNLVVMETAVSEDASVILSCPLLQSNKRDIRIQTGTSLAPVTTSD